MESTKKKCPTCGVEAEKTTKLCKNCGYDFIKKDIQERLRLRIGFGLIFIVAIGIYLYIEYFHLYQLYGYGDGRCGTYCAINIVDVETNNQQIAIGISNSTEYRIVKMNFLVINYKTREAYEKEEHDYSVILERRFALDMKDKNSLNPLSSKTYIIDVGLDADKIFHVDGYYGSKVYLSEIYGKKH